ncbi:hydrolase [Pseudomonas sp. BN411]|uniref:hydrolase n=1 Tax=Pseudomonas sp. BN411 TaxID=2567887 RepID=UPI0024557729|nr:hydrolase [Pseudomonas sp. BN411]
MHVLIMLLALSFCAFVQAEDRDLDNDGRWDFGRGGSDRDVDNDGRWDYDKGGSDRDLDNDGRWDYGAGGSDRDVDNDDRWDYDKGGTDRDLDNDGRWDGRIAPPPSVLYAAAVSQLQPILALRDVTQ